MCGAGRPSTCGCPVADTTSLFCGDCGRDLQNVGHDRDCPSFFYRGDCSNGPDEDGNWPCDPKVLFGLNEAECQVCGRIAAWGKAADA